MFSILTLTPATYGLPEQYDSWRDGQLAAIDQIYLSPARFNVLCAPTGFGKSLVYMAAARMLGWRTLILTSTKGLQDQLGGDFGEISYDLRGKNNFACPIWQHLDIPPNTPVSEAPCNFGYRCRYKAGGCEYYDRYREAQRADVVVTNYACWLNDQHKERSRDGGLEKERRFDLMVMDEAHNAPEELAAYLEVEVSRKECERANVEWPHPGYDLEQWVNWAQHWNVAVGIRVEGYDAALRDGGRLSAGEMRDAARQKRISQKLVRLAGIKVEDQWIHEGNEPGDEVKFSPLWPQRYAEQELFRGAKKVVLVSATVRPKTLDLLGVPENGSENDNSLLAAPNREFVEYSSAFPVANRPVIHVRSVQMRYNMPESDLVIWGNKIDNIITGRPDRKGIIHTVSYARAKWLMERTRHPGRLITHTRWNRAEKVAEFKAMSPESGAVLVSPSMDTGYDFKDDECRWQVIAKLPFPDMRSAVQRARMEVDKEYRNYVTAQDLVQMSGRIVRSERDWGETFILDDNVTWFVRNAREYLPKWWRDAYQSVNIIPAAMKAVTL
jgi:ATP-dependent DNA helicase DinG